MITREELIVAVEKSINEKISLLEKSFELLNKNIIDPEVPTPRLVNNARELRYQYALLLRLIGYSYTDIGKVFKLSSARVNQLAFHGILNFRKNIHDSDLKDSMFEIYIDKKFNKKKMDFDADEIKYFDSVQDVIRRAETYIELRKN